jgi:hypothetical protein
MKNFDRMGKPIDLLTWGKLHNDEKYVRVRETILPDGKWVSTVWLGIDHNWGHGSPLIFETMIFQSREDLTVLDTERYSTEQEAIEGHQRIVQSAELRQSGDHMET